MKAPDYIVIINDFEVFKFEGDRKEVILKAIEAYEKKWGDILKDFLSASKKQKKMYDEDAIMSNQEISSIRVYDFFE